MSAGTPSNVRDEDDDVTVLQTTGREARQGVGAWNSAMPTESSRDFRATVRRLATVCD